MKPFIISLLAAAILSGCVSTQSPTGRSQTLLFSEPQMQKMGAESFDSMKKEQKISNDKKLTSYVNCVAKRITQVLPDPSQTWELALFDAPQVNAFAIPGGYIGVYTGLLSVASTEDQLATVIGHEVAHVLARHGNEQVSRAQMTGIGMQLADAALGVSGISNKDLYMSALGLGAKVGYILPFGRTQESEADVMGLELMAKAGFDPSASITLWQNMAKAGGAQGPELLSTHPSNARRIQDLQAIQEKVMPLYLAAKKQGVNQCKR
jgi:predicted Zn-dependent protease